MFAALTFDRDPLTLSWDTFLGSLNSWTQIVGGFAMVGLVLWLIAYLVSRRGAAAGEAVGTVGQLAFVYFLLGPLGILLFLLTRSKATMRVDAPGPRRSPVTTALFISSFVWAGFAYLLLLASALPELIHWVSEGELLAPKENWRRVLQSVLWTVAGASAIFAVLVPILADLGQLSPRRIWAIARLSFKEAVRRKVLWVFLLLLLIVLFGSWFIQDKPENQVRTYVTVVFFAMALLMLFAAALIACFGIPDDIRHQTIHTVLTKPVQRFEIFLGRFLGYTALMTAALVVVTGLSLLYVLRNIGPEAKEESLKAREPFYGGLTFQGIKDPNGREKGVNVGREWDYRGYIEGKPRNSTDPTQYAVWSFPDVPKALLDRDTARCEFTLDIYRTHKGVEGQGVFCTFFVESWRFDADDPVMKKKYDEREDELRNQKHDPDADKKLAREFGYFKSPSKEIKDYHTQHIEVPREVFENAREDNKARRDELQRRPDWPELQRRHEWPAAPLRVRVQCDSGAQFVGMAKYDLYFRLDHEDATGAGNTARFCLNFFKGSFGLWLRLCLIIGLAVAASTYLSGVITAFTAGILYVLGFLQEFITEVALRKNVGGGPVESMIRLLKRPGGESLAVPLEESTATTVSTWTDEAFSWTLRRVMNVFPDVARFSFTDFVAEGVAVSGGQMAMSLLLLVGYLLPWVVLAYYLLKWREIAGST
jgi:hypothetical protein